MIIADRFLGDANTLLMKVQHDVYGEALGCLFRSAKRSFQHASRMLEAETVLGLIVAPIERFDHRTLQEAHDIIAAHFRRRRPDLVQPELSLDVDEHRWRLEREWRDHFEAEMKRLAEEPEICRSILTAVAYQNTEVGYRAEEELEARLRAEYDLPRHPPAGA